MFEKDEKEMKESRKKIKLKHLIIAFLILGSGWFVALVVFILEKIWQKKVQIVVLYYI